MTSKGDITRFIEEVKAEKAGADDALLSRIYAELHALAGKYMRQQAPGHVLQTTALVHEAYIRLFGGKKSTWENRSHFLRVAAKAMRSILIDHARSRYSEKRGGARSRKPLGETALFLGESAVLEEKPSDELLILDRALTQLTGLDPQAGQIVELRFFGGLTVEETAKVLEISPSTVKRDWRMAKAWLQQEIGKAKQR